MRLVLLTVSHRVAPGLLSRQAWSVLESLPVCTGDPAHPQLPALAAAGVAVTIVEGAAPAQLRAVTARGDDVVWLAAPGDTTFARAVAEQLPGGLQVEHVPGSWDLPGARLLDAVAVMDRLRSPGGCPWDAEQTHASLRPYVLEEAYEVAQAIDDGEPALLAEELGDLLLQVLFHARVAADEGSFDVDAVAGLLVDKMVRRHPHVFAGSGAGVTTAAEVELGWDAIKAVEKGGRSVTGGVAVALPSLALLAKLLGRAAKVGLAPSDLLVPVSPLADALVALVVQARASGEDAEAALAAVGRGVRARLAGAEQTLLDEGQNPSQAPTDAWRAALGR